MTYTRVCPRDLFNEANLLKCLGQLYLMTEGMPGCSWADPQPGEPFVIDQDDADGSLSVANATLLIDGERCVFRRPLNDRDPWPLICTHVGTTMLSEEAAVFTDAGALSAEFMAVIAGGR